MALYDGFDDYQDMVAKFAAENDPKMCKEEEIICAFYETEGSDGEAFVLFEQNWQLFQVNASHCSCFDLENQWDPEKTTWSALKIRKFFVIPEAAKFIRENCPS